MQVLLDVVAMLWAYQTAYNLSTTILDSMIVDIVVDMYALGNVFEISVFGSQFQVHLEISNPQLCVVYPYCK